MSGRRYIYRFEALAGWAPLIQQRGEITHEMRAVLTTADISWDMGGGGNPVSVTIEMDLDGRRSLESLGVIVQAFNTAFIYVDGWPPQSQSCTDGLVPGAYPPPVAIGSVEAVSMNSAPEGRADP